jgi:uncharacterized repeat protein (TIGR03803 family)
MGGKSKFRCVAALAILLLSGSARATDFQVVHAFNGGKDGDSPDGALAADGVGNLYGTTFGDGGNAPGKKCPKSCGNAYALQGGDLQSIFAFDGGKTGSFPEGRLLFYQGSLYGTTSSGGNNRSTACGISGDKPLTCGTLYKLTPDGAETLLYSFCNVGKYCKDGELPFAGVVTDDSGNLYGTAAYGGGNSSGVVYKLSPQGVYSQLYSFCSKDNCHDGAGPFGGVIRDQAGNLYGTTVGGGSGKGCKDKYIVGCGTIFRLSPDGTETVLYSFCSQASCADGGYPQGSLLLDGAGNLFGTASIGGGSNCADPGGPGCGVIFELTASGNFMVLYSFQSGADGAHPLADLIADGQGNLYGTTAEGGGHRCFPYRDGCGTVFELSPSGTETVLHIFCSQKHCSDGQQPRAGLVLQGNYLYGTTFYGGVGLGTLFKVKAQ